MTLTSEHQREIADAVARGVYFLDELWTPDTWRGYLKEDLAAGVPLWTDRDGWCFLSTLVSLQEPDRYEAMYYLFADVEGHKAQRRALQYYGFDLGKPHFRIGGPVTEAYTFLETLWLREIAKDLPDTPLLT